MLMLHGMKALSFFAVTVTLAGSLVAQAPSGLESSVDRVFGKWSQTTPGCAVGVANGGKPALAAACLPPAPPRPESDPLAANI